MLKCPLRGNQSHSEDLAKLPQEWQDGSRVTGRLTTVESNSLSWEGAAMSQSVKWEHTSNRKLGWRFCL